MSCRSSSAEMDELSVRHQRLSGYRTGGEPDGPERGYGALKGVFLETVPSSGRGTINLRL